MTGPAPLSAFSVYMTSDEVQALTLLASRDERSLSHYVRMILRERLALETADPQYAGPVSETRR